MAKTTKQKIAETEMKLQRLKEKERKERTRELIIAGGAITSFLRTRANATEKKMILDSMLSCASKKDRELLEKAFEG